MTALPVDMTWRWVGALEICGVQEWGSQLFPQVQDQSWVKELFGLTPELGARLSLIPSR
jgi:hypothetical protein